MNRVKYVRVKQGLEMLAWLLILPHRLIFSIQSRLLGHTQACLMASQRAARWPGFFGVLLRRALFKQILSRMGKDVSVSMGTILTKPTIELNDSVYIGSYCIVGDAQIGANTLISDFVSILSGNHGLAPNQLIKDQPEHYQTVQIGADCWIGNRAVILADLGDHCVVGAGSVVTKPVPDYAIVAGNPARSIGDRRQHKAEHAC
ncbi:MAG: acyltransferase [Caldilineaceae bacterium]